MPEFFTLLTIDDARARWFETPTPPPESETIASAEALYRVTAEALHSAEALPAFARSTVDGYAVRASDTHGASDALPAYLTLVGEVPMGHIPTVSAGPGEAVLVHTGGALPAGTDAVVMVEHTQPTGTHEIEVVHAVAAGENVIQVGEDVAPGDAVLPSGHIIRAQDIGGLMALGITSLQVARRPSVAIIATGDEVIPPDAALQPGQIRDVNSYTISAQTYSAGGIPRRVGIVPDDFDALYARTAEALVWADMVVISAGSSVSVRDMTANVLDALGTPGVVVHGVAVRPGKPTILGVVEGKPVMGLPGNPVSAMVAYRLLGVPMVYKLQGAVQRALPMAEAKLGANVPGAAGRDDYIPARLRYDAGGTLWAEPIFGKSNLIYRLVHADGLIHVPVDATGLRAGETAEIYSFFR